MFYQCNKNFRWLFLQNLPNRRAINVSYWSIFSFFQNYNFFFEVAKKKNAKQILFGVKKKKFKENEYAFDKIFESHKR